MTSPAEEIGEVSDGDMVLFHWGFFGAAPSPSSSSSSSTKENVDRRRVESVAVFAERNEKKKNAIEDILATGRQRKYFSVSLSV